MQFKIILSILFSLFFLNNNQAQEIWSLEKCILHATQKSLSIKQMDLSMKQAELNEKGNKHNRYPSLNASSDFSYQFGRTIDVTTNDFSTVSTGLQRFGLSANVVLYNGGRINNSIKQSAFDVMAAREDAAQAVNDLALNIATVYLNVLFAEEQLANAQKRAELTIDQLEQTDKLIRAGALPQNDRLDILAQQARDDQNIVVQQNNVALAYLNLKQLLVLEPDFELQIERPNVTIPSEDGMDAMTLSVVYNQAINTQPFIKAGAARLKSAALNIDVAKADLMPRLSLFGNINTSFSTRGVSLDGFESDLITQNVIFNDIETTIEFEQQNPLFKDTPYFTQLSENLGQSLGLSLSIPIYNNNRARINIERAELNIINQKITNERNEQQLKSDIQTAIANAKAARKQLEAVDKTVNALEAAYENTEKRHVLGAVNTFALTTAKNNLDTAKVDYIVAKYDYLFKLKIVDYYQGKEIRL